MIISLVWFKKIGHSSLSFHHPSLITQFSSLITHYLKYPTPFDTVTYLSSLNIFQLFVGPIPVPCAAFTFFFFYLKPPVPKFIKSSGKKKKKKEEGRIEDRTSEKKKKESKVKRCSCGSLHVCLITKMPLSYELWKLKTAKMCFQFP